MVPHLCLVPIGTKEAIVLLSILDCDLSFKVDVQLFIDEIYAKCVEHLVHFIHNVWVLHHLASVEPDKVVFAHIIRQICKHKGTLLGLIY